jgi:hypothetical protein
MWGCVYGSNVALFGPWRCKRGGLQHVRSSCVVTSAESVLGESAETRKFLTYLDDLMHQIPTTGFEFRVRKCTHELGLRGICGEINTWNACCPCRLFTHDACRSKCSPGHAAHKLCSAALQRRFVTGWCSGCGLFLVRNTFCCLRTSPQQIRRLHSLRNFCHRKRTSRTVESPSSLQCVVQCLSYTPGPDRVRRDHSCAII